MGKVDIKSTQKKTIQKVKLWQVDTVQMKITYLQEGVLHDMRIAEVKAIYPCSQSRHMLVFNNPRRPQIIVGDQTITNYAAICDFVQSEPANQADSLLLLPQEVKSPKVDSVLVTPPIQPQAIKPTTAVIDSTLKDNRYDTIVRPNAVRVRIIVVSQTTKALVYRRHDNPTGPVYYVNPNTILQTTRRLNGLTFIQNYN